MPSPKVEVFCHLCEGRFYRQSPDIKKAIANTGYWACKKCTLTKRNKKNRRPLWAKRIKKQNNRVEIKTRLGWRLLQIQVLESYLGRRLEPDECVHHCDKDRNNNKISNLELMLRSKHTILHNTGRSVSKETRKKMSDIKKGRASKLRSLTYEIAQQIRSDRELLGMTHRELSIKYGTPKHTVQNILRNKNYKTKD